MVLSAQAVPDQHPPPVDLSARVYQLEAAVKELSDTRPRADNVSLLVFSGELDKILAGLVIATTAASMGMNVNIFFTFWGINALKEKRVLEGKGVMERMIDVMTPTGPDSMGVSQMNMFGAGSLMLKQMMKEKEVVSAQEMLELAREAGVTLTACSMTMEVTGIRKEELSDGVEIAGAAAYLQNASRSALTLFI